MMKKTILLLVFISYFTKSFSQKDNEIPFKNSYAINLEALYFHDFKLSFSHKLNNLHNICFESMLSYNFPSTYLEDNFSSPFGDGATMDPFYLYGRIQVRAGLKEYFSRRYYLGEMFLFNYGQFRDGYVALQDGFADVNRIKTDFEFLVKTGWTFDIKGFLLDFYIGGGIRFKNLNDKLLGFTEYDDDPPGPLPSWIPNQQSNSYIQGEAHFGIQIGYCK